LSISDEERKRKRNERARKWRKENPEKVKEQNKRRNDAKIKWRKENPEKLLETNRKYYEKNKEKIDNYRKEWTKKNKTKLATKARERYQSDPEKARKESRERRAKNPEQYRKWARDYYAKNPEKHRENTKQWRTKNPEKSKAYRDKYQKENKEFLKERRKSPKYVETRIKHQREVKLQVFTAYSKRISESEIPCCACCGENNHVEFLTIDHIEGRTNLSDKEKTLKGPKLYQWLRRHHYPKGYQVLCWNCNSAKGLFGKCPHQK